MTSMNPTPPESLSEVSPDARLELLRADLQKIERRDWRLWVVAMLVMLLLTAAVLSMSFPGLVAADDPTFQESLNRAVRGLIGLVLLFNIYCVYQQITLKRARRQISGQLAEAQKDTETLHIQATTDPLTWPIAAQQKNFSQGRCRARGAASLF